MKPRFRLLHVVALLALSVIALVANAQPKNLPRIAWVLGTGPESRNFVDAIHAGLADEGLVDGRDVILDMRFAGGRPERYPELFADLMRMPAQVLAAAGFVGISAARDASGGRIPVAAYFCGNDIKGMVESFAKPGGNISGVSCLSAELAVKRVQLLREAMPDLRHIGFFYDPRSNKDMELADVRAAATGLGMSVSPVTASSPDAIASAIASARRDGAEALLISEDTFTMGNRVAIVSAAAKHRMPAAAAFREFADAGAVFSYGASNSERLRQQARYAARMIRGARPSDLPVEQPRRFELVINQTTAQALGVPLPKGLLQRADDVIR